MIIPTTSLSPSCLWRPKLKRIWKIFLKPFIGVPFSWILMCTPLLPNSTKLVSRPTHWPAWCSSHQALRASILFRCGHFFKSVHHTASFHAQYDEFVDESRNFSTFFLVYLHLSQANLSFFFLFFLPQSLLDINYVTSILSQLDEQRQRGRTLTQADTVRHCSWAREQTLYHLCGDVDTTLRMHTMSKRLYAVYTFCRDHDSHRQI